MNKDKAINFCNLVKSLGYTNIDKYSPNGFEYLFEVEDTKVFFEWFLANVNYDCVLSKSEIKIYQEKFKKSQIISNIEKLKALCNIKAHDETVNDFETVDGYKKRIEQKEEMVKLYQQRNNMRKHQKQCLIDELSEIKLKKKNQFEKIQHELSLKQIYMKNMFKSVNVQFKSLIKILNNELSVNGSFASKFQDASKTEIENLVLKEESYLNLVRNLLNSGKIFEIEDNSINEFKSRIQLYEHYYPKLILKWFNTKLELSIQQSNLNELLKFQKSMTAFLMNKNSCNSNESVTEDFSNLSEKVNYMDMNLKIIVENCEKIGNKIALTVKELTNLKLLKLISYDAESKILNYNFLILKQENLLNSLINQHSRINLLIDIEKVKLNDINLVKQMFELVKSKSTSTSGNNSMTNFSTNYESTFMNQTSSMSLSTRKIQPKSQHASNSNEKFYRIINQLLIIYLTKLNVRCNNLKVSIHLNENLTLIVDIYKKCLTEAKKARVSTKKDLALFYKQINETVQYLYGSTSDLSKIGINMKLVNSNERKQLDDNINEIQNLFYSNIFQPYNYKKSILENNKLEKIKRNFFIDFYLSPQNVSNIIESL